MKPINWDLDLIEAVTKESGTPFDWGTSNCGHLMAQSVRIQHGDNHPLIQMLTGAVDEKATKRILAKGGGLAAILGKHLEEIHPIMAQTGDLGIVEGNGVQAGVLVMDGVGIGKAEQGVFRVSFRTLTKAFRV